MQAVGGATPDLLVQQKVGLFVPGTPMASDVGVEAMQGAKDPDKLRRKLAEAGYRGEKVVALGATDIPSVNAISQVGADLLRCIGCNVDVQVPDCGIVQQRRASRQPPADRQGWLEPVLQFADQHAENHAGHGHRAAR